MNRKAWSFAIVSLVLGFGLGFGANAIIQRQESRGLIAAHELQIVGYAANTLNCLPDRPETANKIQLLALESALQRLEELTLQLERFPISTNSLEEGLNRAVRYGEQHGRPDIKNQATLVKKRLFGGA